MFGEFDTFISIFTVYNYTHNMKNTLIDLDIFSINIQKTQTGEYTYTNTIYVSV